MEYEDMKEPEFDEYDIAWAKYVSYNLIDAIIAYMKEHPDDEECDARNIYLWMRGQRDKERQLTDIEIQYVGYDEEQCGRTK